MGVVKFGLVKGPVVSQEFYLAASQVFKHLSGTFMQLNSSGQVLIAAANVTDIIGSAITGEWTSSASAGVDKVAVNTALDAEYEMPIYGDGPSGTAIAEATLKGYVGKMCDLNVTSNIQSVNTSGTSYNVVQVVGYNYYGSGAGQQTLIVKLVPKNLTTAA
jgi:hypothetical protein